jgi:beta-mannosidase
MIRHSLNGSWQMSYGPEQNGGPDTPEALFDAKWPSIPAHVPGNVELALLDAGLIKDPAVGSNVYDLRACETHEWWYRRSFAQPECSAAQQVTLVFEGIDCVGTVWLNGVELGKTDNMFIAHRFDVTALLREENELVVRLGSAVLAGRRHSPEPLMSAVGPGYEGLSIRKAPHMYGWDIMPRVVSAGLWRGVALEVRDPACWRSVYWTTLQADDGARTATVLVDWDFESASFDIDNLRVTIDLANDGNTVYHQKVNAVETHGRTRITLDDVALWWPRGMGAAALHDATLTLSTASGEILDTHTCRVGFRTIALRRTPITTVEDPGEFVFVVNGHKLFAKGTNWVPLDAMHSRDAAHLDAVTALLADLNCNMVRCWGGNVYEDHPFFDWCDAAGILVWQDFAFACAIYPQTGDFLARVREEAEAVVTKLRNHASLALWAGNNECDQAHGWGGMDLNPNEDRISRDVLPSVVRRLDPMRPYLPSSPYISPEATAHEADTDSLMPEAHLWGPRSYYKDAYYAESQAHFVSEAGYFGCPVRETLEQMFEPEYLWPWQENDQWLTKCVRPLPNVHDYDYRVQLLADHAAHLFGKPPEDLDDFILASQSAQGEAYKFLVEHWRSRAWRRTGMLWWNLRDGWPILSDAVVDYYNRPKLAYHYLKRAQGDLCVIVCEAEDGKHDIVASNATLATISGNVVLRDVDGGNVVFEAAFQAEANSATLIGMVAKSAVQGMWLIDWAADEKSGRSHYLCGEPPYALADYRCWLQAMRGEDWPVI